MHSHSVVQIRGPPLLPQVITGRQTPLARLAFYLLEAESEDMTRDMLNRIAAVFGVHPAVLCMSPDEHAFASVLEQYRDIPKDAFQKFAGELVSKGFHRSKGAA